MIFSDFQALLGAAEVFPLPPRVQRPSWPGLDENPWALLPEARTALLLAIPYRSYQWEPQEVQVNAFYPAYQQGRAMALSLAEALRGRGMAAVSAPNLPLKPLAAGTGAFFYGRNCLTASRAWGTRFTLQCVLTSGEFAQLPWQEEFRLDPACDGCRACVAACPTGALRGDGTMDATRCLRNLPYNAPVPLELREAVGANLYGCDVCQQVCPRNRGQAFCPPPEELRRALDLKALLSGVYKPLAPFLGGNYARRNRVMGRAALIAGNVGDEKVFPLLEALAESEQIPAAEHAAWALERLGRKGATTDF